MDKKVIKSPRALLAEYKKERTLEAVAKKSGVTRERIRQIFAKHCAGAYQALRKSKPKLLYPFKCLGCGKKSESPFHKKFCNRACLHAYHVALHAKPLRKCTGCKKTKPRSEFYPMYDWGKNWRLMSRCKDCFTKLTLQWKKKHPIRWKRINRKAVLKWHKKHRK